MYAVPACTLYDSVPQLEDPSIRREHVSSKSNAHVQREQERELEREACIEREGVWVCVWGTTATLGHATSGSLRPSQRAAFCEHVSPLYRDCFGFDFARTALSCCLSALLATLDCQPSFPRVFPPPQPYPLLQLPPIFVPFVPLLCGVLFASDTF